MTSERKRKIIILSALIVSIVALAVGFAAFSAILDISSGATIKPDASKFIVKFSSSSSELETNPIQGSPLSLGDYAYIDNTGNPSITGLSAKFTTPGQSVTYTFYARNVGAYIAYLNSITYLSISGESSFRKCELVETTNEIDKASQDLVTAACNSINVSVKVDGLDTVTETSSEIIGHKLPAGETEKVVVTISYSGSGVAADGPFIVNFGDISLNYNSHQQYATSSETTGESTVETTVETTSETTNETTGD